MARVRTVSLVSIPRLEIVEVVLTAGFDGVLIDLEHGPITVSDLPPLVAAARAFGADCLVRVDSSHSEAIGRALDVGVTGIVVPRIAKAEEASHAVEVAKFSGGRGFNPFVRAGGYGARAGFVEDADDEIEVICMIEGVSGLANALEIMQVQGVNTVFLGPYDMSVALGHPGETGHPEVVAAIEGVIRIAESEGVLGWRLLRDRSQREVVAGRRAQTFSSSGSTPQYCAKHTKTSWTTSPASPRRGKVTRRDIPHPPGTCRHRRLREHRHRPHV